MAHCSCTNLENETAWLPTTQMANKIWNFIVLKNKKDEQMGYKTVHDVNVKQSQEKFNNYLFFSSVVFTSPTKHKMIAKQKISRFKFVCR